MLDWKKVLVSPSASIRDTITVIDVSGMQIAIVVDEDQRLLGIVTDGDVRRGILNGVSLDDSVRKILNLEPIVAKIDEDPKRIALEMKRKGIRHIPVVDDDGQVVRLETLGSMQTKTRDNIVVLMAGGLGTRLQPLTNDCPKPLLKVGGKPILQIILENFIDHGFERFFFSVNYKSEMIKEYFQDGARWGVDIQYIHEQKRMGTAGALTLLQEQPTKPLIVMNGDLLTKVNFSLLLDYHLEHKADATMCVREFNYQVPYGVVNIEEHRLSSIVEKPIQRFFVSAGIYVLDPKTLKVIPKDSFYDMPNLFDDLMNHSYETTVYPVREYWRDIGRMDDFEQANKEYLNHFIG